MTQTNLKRDDALTNVISKVFVIFIHFLKNFVFCHFISGRFYPKKETGLKKSVELRNSNLSVTMKNLLNN